MISSNSSIIVLYIIISISIISIAPEGAPDPAPALGI